MITKSEFFNLIEDFQEWRKDVETVSSALGIKNPYEDVWIGYAAILFDKTIDLLFNEDGVDDIDWWLYEKSGNPELRMWDADGKEIPTDTVEDLWNLVKYNRQ